MVHIHLILIVQPLPTVSPTIKQGLGGDDFRTNDVNIQKYLKDATRQEKSTNQWRTKDASDFAIPQCIHMVY